MGRPTDPSALAPRVVPQQRRDPPVPVSPVHPPAPPPAPSAAPRHLAVAARTAASHAPDPALCTPDAPTRAGRAPRARPPRAAAPPGAGSEVWARNLAQDRHVQRLVRRASCALSARLTSGSCSWLAHARHDEAPQIEESELRDKFADFELTLHGFVGRFHTTAKFIDAALERANVGGPPSEAELSETVRRLAALEHERRFFKRLTNPAWIKPPEARGFFRSPPPPERVGSDIPYRSWHQLEYLARMAPMAAQVVVDVLKPLKFSNAMDVLSVVKVCQRSARLRW